MLIGIDLGTTNTSVSYVDKKGKLTILPLGEQKNTMPSILSIVNGEVYIGEAAKRQALVHAQNTVLDIKRILGRKFTDAEVQNSLLKYPYRLIKGDRNQVRVVLGQDTYSIEQLMSFMLMYIKKIFKQFTGQDVTNSVITVPAYFNNIQRKAMMDAAHLADLNVQRLISEPTAAAMAYGYFEKNNKLIAVYDLGGGTFDISLLAIKDNSFRVLSSYGDTFLGGSDIDHHLFEHLCQDIWDKHKIYIKDSPMLTYKVRAACENIKKELSEHRKVAVEFPFLKGPDGNVVSYAKEVKRETLEIMSRPIVEKTLITVQRCMERAGLKKSDLDDVVLVGGQSKMPMIMDRVANFFGRTTAKIINQDEIVSAGAAIYGDALTQKRKTKIILKDVLPQSMSIRKNLKMRGLFKAGQALPLQKTVTISLEDDEKNHTLFIDEGSVQDHHPPENMGQVHLNQDLVANQKSVDVEFSINESGLFSAKLATDATAAHKAQFETHGLNKQEIEQAKNSPLADLPQNHASKEHAQEQLQHLLAKVKGLYLDQKAMFSHEQKEKIEKIFQLGPAVLNHGDQAKMQKMLESLYILQQQLI